MGWSTSIKIAAIAVVLSLAAGCKSDGDSTFWSSAVSAGRSAPTIAGSPKTSVAIGEQYVFAPRASDPDGTPLRFEVSNQPRWSKFDVATGVLSGQPTAADVGTYPGVTISVTDGDARKSLAPFDIKVVQTATPAATTPGSSWTPEPLPERSAGSAFEFAEIPEIVFVRGYAETEHLGIFHLDTQNRWTPGDLENQSGWKPRVVTQLNMVSGNSIAGVSYDPATGVLNYDGSGSGSETITVYLSAPAENVRSTEFNIRVLAPTIAWGVNAAARFPGIGYDSATTLWQDMQRNMQPASYAEPNVLLVTSGEYVDNFMISSGKLNLYVLGEPTGRPVVHGDNINFTKFETAYLKNLELWDTVVDGAGYLTDRKVNFYATKIYQHDSTRERSGFGSPAYEGNSRYGIVIPPGEWRHWIWNFHGSQMGGTGNTTHQFYLEGRPNTYAIFNNIRITGTRGCSAIKTTRNNVLVRNSHISTLQDPSRPEIGLRATILLDIASASSTTVYNNHLVGAYNKVTGGLGSAMLFFRARRDWWGADSPAYPDVSWDPPTTSLVGGGYSAPLGFGPGPETFVSKAFWDAVRSIDVSDPANPYTFQKYVAYNTFTWVDEGDTRRAAIRDDGTAPRTAAAQFSHTELWGTVPSNWVERSVTFVGNNLYRGWTVEDTSNPRRWIHIEGSTPQSLVTLVGPGPWAYPAPPRTLVSVGGESGPNGDVTPTALPSWFRK